MHETLPREAAQALGEPLARYRFQRPTARWAACAAACVLAGMAFVFAWPLRAQILVLVMLGLAVVGLFKTRGQASLVTIHRGGFVSESGSKAAPERCAWDEVERVQQDITRNRLLGFCFATTHRYRVQRRDGKQFTFWAGVGLLPSGLERIEELGATIQQEVTRRLLPRAIATYNDGGLVPFGKLGVSPQGLRRGQETIPWSELREVRVELGQFETLRGERWVPLARTADIPNLFVFLQLVQAIFGRRA